MVIVGVIQKVDSPIDGGIDDADAFRGIFLDADVVAAQANGRDSLARFAERASRNISVFGA